LRGSYEWPLRGGSKAFKRFYSTGGHRGPKFFLPGVGLEEQGSNLAGGFSPGLAKAGGHINRGGTGGGETHIGGKNRGESAFHGTPPEKRCAGVHPSNRGVGTL